MPEIPHLADELFNAIPLDERADFLYRAGVYTTAPSDLIALQLWRDQNRPRLTLALLRRLNFSDEQVIRAVSEGDLPVELEPRVAGITLHLSLFPGTNDGRIFLTELAATSGITLEIFRDVAAALQPLGVASDPPSVTVTPGTVNYTAAAAPLAVSVGLVCYCLGLVPAPTAVVIGGAITASKAIIDLALNWADKIAEIRRKNAETAKLKAEAQNLIAEAEAHQREAQKLLREAEMAEGRPLTGVGSLAMSALVPEADVHAAAELLGIGDALAHHILNRGLPAALEARTYVPEIRLYSGKAAGAG